MARFRILRQDCEFVGFGGPQMAAAGCDLLYDLTQHAVMFFSKVLRQIATFRRLLRQADDYFRTQRVDAVVLIDYPGFNWWVARAAKRRGIPVFYYGTPQMWAWAPWRVRKIRRFVDHVLCQHPFEPAWYAARECRAQFVGHPFFDDLDDARLDRSFLQDFVRPGERRLVLLPGSRSAEVTDNLECFLGVARRVKEQLPQTRIAFACFNQAQADVVQARVAELGLTLEVHCGRTPELIHAADACVACSGSVSLQLLAARKPTVIYYRLGQVAWWLQRIFLRVKYITLVNLYWAQDIRKVGWSSYDPERPGAETLPMPEYLTTTDQSPAIARRILTWLTDEEARQTAVRRLDQVARGVAKPGASQRAALAICAALEKRELDQNRHAA